MKRYLKNSFLKRISIAAPKAQIGTWENVGQCIGTGKDPSCGPGIQNQTRSCIDGTQEKCSEFDLERIAPCHWADSTLPDCEGLFNIYLLRIDLFLLKRY